MNTDLTAEAHIDIEIAKAYDKAATLNLRRKSANPFYTASNNGILVNGQRVQQLSRSEWNVNRSDVVEALRTWAANAKDDADFAEDARQNSVDYEETHSKLATMTKEQTKNARYYEDVKGTVEAADQAEAAFQQAWAKYKEADKQYAGWSRFFAVTGGHVHSSMSCSTCNKRGKATTFSWVPSLSGLDEASAVNALGPTLCSVCFPSAPVEHQQQAKLTKTALRDAGVNVNEKA